MRQGSALIETLVAIALIGAMFSVFGTVISADLLRLRSRYETQAVALAEGALAAALALPPSALTNRAASPLLGFVEKRGVWQVKSNAAARSTPNILTVTDLSPAIYGVTASLRVPFAPQADVTAGAAVRAPVGSPGDWRAGFIFRARDLGDCYRYTIGGSSLTLEKLVDGAPTALYTAASGVTPGTWADLTVTATGASLTISRDGVPLTTVTDSTWNFGDVALVVSASSTPAFDDVTLSGALGGSWNFDSDAVGLTPPDWRAFGVADLPSGAASIIVDNPTGDASLVRAMTAVTWRTSAGERGVTTTGYVRR